MNKSLYTLLGITTIIVLSGWGTPESNVAGNKKQAVNFFATLETWANPGTELKIENLSIDNLYKQIPLYLKPALATPSTDTTTAIDCSKCCPGKVGLTQKYKEFILTGDPRNTLIEKKMDLAEVSEITIPHPDEMWTYQKEKGYIKAEYIEIVISSKNNQKTKTSYLLEKRKRIYADRISEAGPEEQEIPLEAVKSLKIEGYNNRKLEETKKIQAAHQAIIKQKTENTDTTKPIEKSTMPATNPTTPIEAPAA